MVKQNPETASRQAAGIRPPDPHPSGAKPPDIPAELVPRHVALVMDGDGRWAKKRGLPRTEGHKEGESSLLDVIMGAIELGIPYLSAYAFSTENWRRSPDEVRFLMGFNRDVIHRRRDLLNEMGVRIRWAGRRPRLWRSVISELEYAEQLSAGNTVLTLQFCVNYGGRAEIVDAAAAIAADAWPGNSARRRSPKRCSPDTWTSQGYRRSIFLSGHPASSAFRTSCCGSRPTPSWSFSIPSGPISTGATYGTLARSTPAAIAATAAPSPIPFRPRRTPRSQSRGCSGWPGLRQNAARSARSAWFTRAVVPQAPLVRQRPSNAENMAFAEDRGFPAPDSLARSSVPRTPSQLFLAERSFGYLEFLSVNPVRCSPRSAAPAADVVN